MLLVNRQQLLTKALGPRELGAWLFEGFRSSDRRGHPDGIRGAGPRTGRGRPQPGRHHRAHAAGPGVLLDEFGRLDRLRRQLARRDTV
jgi:hypothetical protein